MAEPVFQCLRLCVRSCDPERVERVAAEVWAAGAAGVEEREAGDDTLLLVYADARACTAITAALADARGLPDLEASGPEVVDDADWSEVWKEGLEAIVVSPRLVVRPSFVPPAATGAVELVIDPGQAFGTGGHASTLLALEWVDALAESGALDAKTRVLDVGAGTGVLALAALRLGAGFAVGFDLDPLSAPEARRTAVANGCATALRLFTGPIEAMAPSGFDLVVANLLRREMLPIATEMAAQVAPSGRLVLSGLLAAELDAVSEVFARLGLRRVGARRFEDATGDHWGSLLLES